VPDFIHVWSMAQVFVIFNVQVQRIFLSASVLFRLTVTSVSVRVSLC
jgi:hypothetical protein